METLETQIKDYLACCEHQKKLNAKTLKSYRIDLTQFFVFMPVDRHLEKDNLNRYIQHLHSVYKPKSAKRKIASLRAFLNYLEFDEQIDQNPLNKIRLSFQEPVVLPKSLPIKSVQKILKEVYAEASDGLATLYRKRTALRDTAVLELLFATGIRVSELCSISATDIDLREGAAFIYGKGSRERIVHIANRDVLSCLRSYHTAYASVIKASGCFFVNRLGTRLSEQSVRFMIQRYAEKAGLLHVTPHMFRHPYVKHTLNKKLLILCEL